MLSPAITVTVSLVLVAAIGYVIGLTRGRHLSAGERVEDARRRLAEVDLAAARVDRERLRERETQARRRHLESDLARVRDELEAARLAVANARRETEELEHGYSAQIEQRAAHIDELQAARQRSEERCRELHCQLQDRSHELERALGARAEVERQAGDRERLAEARRGELSEALQHAESERVATNAMLAEVTAVGQRTQAELERTQTAVQSLTARGEHRLRERTLEATRVTGLLRSREEELEQTVRLAAALREQVTQEEARCDTRDQRIAVLEQEQQRLLGVRDRLLGEIHDREPEIRQLRALVLSGLPDEDDLEAIDGIGPSIATLLQSLGVRSFRQIAAWDRHTMSWLTAREPRLQGRLRAEWVDAARAAHADKYGQPPD